LAVLAALVSLSLPFLVHPWFDVVNDAGTYIITACSIAAGDGYSYLSIRSAQLVTGSGIRVS